MNIRLPIQRKLFLSHFFAVVLVSGSIGTYFYLSAAESLMGSLQARLRNSAALVSQTVDARELAGIRGAADVSRPAYRKYLALLRDFKHTNPDVAFLYVMRREGGRVLLVIDKDESEEQALPGREYRELVPALLAGFSGPSVDAQIATDEWGTFLSGYAPPRNGVGAYLIGMDMRADEVAHKFRRLRLSGMLSLACSVLLAVLFSRALSQHFITGIQVLVSRCQAIAEGRLDEPVKFQAGDELDRLFQAFNGMSAHLVESREQHRQAQEALLHARDDLERRVEERTRDLTEMNARLTHEIAERVRAEDALAEAARSDYLTGLPNRRALIEQMAYEVVRCQRSRTPFSILLADVDHFKRVNDTRGHAAGDEALCQVAQRMRESVRAQDLVSRWGGEEFLVLLTETDLPGALVAAEKVRAAVESRDFPAGQGAVRITLSIGATAYLAGQSVDECIHAADAALYQAKAQGRNCVAAAGGEGVKGR